MFVGIPAVSGEDFPPFPHSFYGEVTLNGVPAPDGTQVSATVSEGTIVSGFEFQNPVETVNGEYGAGEGVPRLLVQGSEIPKGATITFYVNGVSTEKTYLYESGVSNRVDLSINTSATPAPTPVPTQGSISYSAQNSGSDSTPASTPVSTTASTPVSTTASTPVSTPASIPVSTVASDDNQEPQTTPSETAEATPAQTAGGIPFIPVIVCVIFVITAAVFSHRKNE